MATTGESSSAVSVPTNDKPVVVRVKRKITLSPLDAFWLEINERPLKRPLVDFGKLSISELSGKDEFKPKKVFVQHVETLTTSEATIGIVQSFVSTSADALDGKTKSEERRHAFKKENRHDQHISKAKQKHEELAKNARFEQIWRSRKGNKEEMLDKELREMCHFYDVVRVDAEERSNEVQKQDRDISLEDQSLLSSYLPLLREFLPSHAAEIEADIHAIMSEKDDYVYDYYTVNDDMKVDTDDGSNPFLRVQVDAEDYYDGPDESEYDSEDSNAENNPLNDYPDEMSGEDEEEEEDEKEDGVESKASNESEDSSEGGSVIVSRDPDLLYDDDLYYDDFNVKGDDFIVKDDDFDYYDENDEDCDNGGDGEDWRWSYR
ncbi:hypothetical protein Ddye_012721 [Dipteronia dyeriana]|uniref:Transcription factor Iwr1 domain-containing protein n=1 Tax=Dipteronia dyeriana TaxID=168575 RepID=A0AAD9X4Y7_9ROSI|nr:hypothetical protein Ddye_012721 [Dipteronia dyeriana]